MEIDIRGLSTVLKKHQETGLWEQGRHWAIGRGGYDLNWQVYYNNAPIVECVKNDINGYALANDAELFAEKIRYILENDEIYNRMSQASLSIYNDSLTVDKMVSKYYDLYKTIAEH